MSVLLLDLPLESIFYDRLANAIQVQIQIQIFYFARTHGKVTQAFELVTVVCI